MSEYHLPPPCSSPSARRRGNNISCNRMSRNVPSVLESALFSPTECSRVIYELFISAFVSVSVGPHTLHHRCTRSVLDGGFATRSADFWDYAPPASKSTWVYFLSVLSVCTMTLRVDFAPQMFNLHSTAAPLLFAGNPSNGTKAVITLRRD